MSKQILMIIAPEQYRDEELTEPRDLFKTQGWHVETVSTQTGDANGMLGAVETISKTVEDVDGVQYDAVVVVGGGGSPEHLWDNETIHTIVNQVYKSGKTVAAICLSGAVLAKAGLLSGKKATVWNDDTAIEALKTGGAQYTGEPVTADGRIITANGPEAATAFGKAVIESVNALIAA